MVPLTLVWAFIFKKDSKNNIQVNNVNWLFFIKQ
jgi:hypothetical protein